MIQPGNFIPLPRIPLNLKTIDRFHAIRYANATHNQESKNNDKFFHVQIILPIYNCSPTPVRNKDLGKAIGKVLHRPSFLPAPGFMIEPILGEFGSVLLKGQRVIPRRLLDASFKFRYPDIEAALKNVIED